MSAKSALAAQLDALMGKERNVPENQVRVSAPRCCARTSPRTPRLPRARNEHAQLESPCDAAESGYLAANKQKGAILRQRDRQVLAVRVLAVHPLQEL
jgi:hypothetical protein